MGKVRFAVVGVRNFAQEHIQTIRSIEAENLAILRAVVIEDQNRNSAQMEELQNSGVEVFASYSQLLEEGQGKIDVISLPTSIHTHYDLALRGMQAGYNLLLEKPPVPTVQQIDDLIKIEQETGTFCSIGFQMIHARTIRRLKQMVLDGDLGEIIEINCRGYWPRTRAYYARNRWAGQTIIDGQLVLDGPIHNALAHYLNNMLYLTGGEFDASADLSWVRAELYRSRPFIASEDTSCLEIETKKGAKIYFYVTHSSPHGVDPIMEIKGTKGKASWKFNEETQIEFSDGRTLNFDGEGSSPWKEVMRVAAKAHRGDIPTPYCTLANSRSFVVALNGAYDSAQYITPIPERYLEYAGTGSDQWTIVKDVVGIMDRAREERKLISDLGVAWGRKTRRVCLQSYNEFNPFGGAGAKTREI